jgi:hypothetical protein
MSLLKNDFFSLSTVVEEALRSRLRGNSSYTEVEIADVMKRSEKLFDAEKEISRSITEDFRALTKFAQVELRPRELTSHRKYIGRFIVLFKKCAFKLMSALLKDTLRSQEIFNRKVVKTLATLSKEAPGSK